MSTASISKILMVSYILFLSTQLGKHFFFPFSYISGVRIDYLAPTLYVTDIIALLLISLNIKTLFAYVKRKEFFIFLALLGVNILFSFSKPIAFYKSVKILEIVALFFIFRDHYKQVISEKITLIALLAGGVLQLSLATLQLANKHSIQGVFYWLGERYFSLSTPGIAKVSLQGVEILRAYGTFSHPNSLAGFYLLVYYFVLTNETFKKHSILKYAVLLISSLLIFVSFSKIAIACLIILNIIYVIAHRKEIKCTFCVVARIAIIAIVPLIFFSAQGDVASWDKRVQVVQNSLSIIVSHPIFGVGLGNYLYAEYAFPIKYSFFFLQPVHSIFLLLISEGGVILAGYIFYQLFCFIKQNVKKEQFIYLLAVVITTGMFDHYWFTLQQNMLLLPFIFALL